MATTSSAERRLPGVRLARPVVILLIVETVLLYFSTSRLDATIFFRVLRLQAGGSLGATLSVALALVTFALPSILGWLARAWTGAIGLALLPWWLTIILHAGTMLRARTGIGGFGLAFGTPMWLTASYALSLLLTFLIFAVLGLAGWFFSQAFSRS